MLQCSLAQTQSWSDLLNPSFRSAMLVWDVLPVGEKGRVILQVLFDAQSSWVLVWWPGRCCSATPSFFPRHNSHFAVGFREACPMVVKIFQAAFLNYLCKHYFLGQWCWHANVNVPWVSLNIVTEMLMLRHGLILTSHLGGAINICCNGSKTTRSLYY